jgi:hypothetical protein
MGQVSPTFTDYAPSCGELQQKFLELLAQSVVEYNDHYYLNIIYASGNCDTLTPFINCNNNNQTPDEVLSNLFALDECGNLGIKMFLNDGES